MLPCTRCPSRRVHQTATRPAPTISYILTHTHQPRSSLYPRWFHLTTTRCQSAQSLAPSAPSATCQDKSNNKEAPSSPAGPSCGPATSPFSATNAKRRSQRDYASIQAALRERSARLPRSKSSSDTFPHQEVANLPETPPSFKSAREPFITPRSLQGPPATFRFVNSRSVRRESQPEARPLPKFKVIDNAAWHELINLLCSLPTRHDLPDGHFVDITHAFGLHITASLRPNTWYQPSGTGSVAHLLPSHQSHPGSRRLVLYGTERAVELAEHDIKALQSEFHALQSHSHSPFDSPSTPFQTLGNLDLTSVDSISSFTRFVLTVTKLSIPRSLLRESVPPANQTAANVLARLFQDPKTSKFASTVALNTALSFLCKHSELTQTVDLLHRCSRALNLGLDVSTANLLLACAINAQNPSKARSLLLEMRKLGTPANSHTWSLFFAATNAEIKLRVLRLMEERRLIVGPRATTAIRKAVLNAFFPAGRPDIRNLQDLLKTLDDALGPDWMNLDAYHHLLKLCTSRKRPTSDTINFLRQLPSKRKLTPNDETTLCFMSLDGSKGLARSGLSFFIDRLTVADHHKLRRGLPSLFRAAWNRNYFNVCHVLWSQAAARGQITYKMQETVNRHLLRNAATDSSTNNKRRLGARIVAGVQWWGPQEAEHLRAALPKLSHHFAHAHNPAFWLARYTPDDGTRDEQLSLAYLILKDDLEAWKNWKPMTLQLLADMLTQAYDLDMQWIRAGRLSAKTGDEIVDLMRERLRVELEPLGPFEANEYTAKALRRMKMLNSALDGNGDQELEGQRLDKVGNRVEQ